MNNIPVFIHKPTGELVPDDPFIVSGTRVQIIAVDYYWGWYEKDIGVVGVIKERDVQHTLSSRRRKNDIDAVYFTVSLDGRESQVGATQSKLKVIETT